MNLKTRAVAATAGILLLVLAFNTGITITVSTGKYREALMARTSAVAETFIKDITRAIGFGLPLNQIEGMGDKLRALADEDRDVSRALITDMDGRVLYASDKAIEQTVLTDKASKKALSAGGGLVHSYSDEAGGHYEKVFPISGLDNTQIGALRISLKKSAVNRQTLSLILWSLVVALISFGVATLLVYFFVDRAISRPLADQVTIAGGMAAGDLSRDVKVSGETEIAALGGAINTMTSNFREVLGKMKQTGAGLREAMTMMSGATVRMSRGAKVQQEATEQTATTVSEMTASIGGVAENAEVMSRAAAEASSSATEMASSIDEVAGSASELSLAAEETAASIAQMLSSIKQVSGNAEQLSESAEQTSSSITEMGSSVKEVEARAREAALLAEKVSREASQRGMAAIREAIKGMQNIKEAVEATADAVNRLGSRSREIGRILKVIDDVTDQTSLLALNAAILAAQAGEQGKGFSVVAEEIKDLAERTAASTQEITDLISAVRAETEQSVQAMARGLDAVETGSGLVNITSEVLEQVSESSLQSATMARAIERTTAEQARSVAQITGAAASIADRIEQIARATQEQHQGSQRIKLAADTMRDITRQVKIATQEQSSGGKLIAAAVESIKEQAARIARSTSEQNIGAKQISEAVGRIQTITQETMDVSIEMDMAVQALKTRSEALSRELESFKF